MPLDTTSYALPVARTIADLREEVAGWRAAGERIGFVPTMGALHEGHLSLVDLAGQNADKVVVSIFVNPTQFAPHEDLDAYPRTEGEDAAKLADHPANLIFAPNANEMYPEGYDLSVSVGGPSEGLESDARPHFFGGVATVVAKLFVAVAPDVAVFGEKDYQQLQVVKKLVRDLGLPIEIVPGTTTREWDGLAMSSRNAYLSGDERKRASQLYAALNEVAHQLKDGAGIDDAREAGRAILREAGFGPIDYLEVRDAASLKPIETVTAPARILAAAKLGTTRLIDNIPLEV
jgi:pantoate--beta-alanine ligase